MKSDKEKIDKLITLEKENNLINHILTSLFNRGETIAEKNLSEYTIWMTNYWVGTFYPIFKISFNENNEIKNIKTELSLYGKLWFIILTGLILTFLSFLIFIPMIESYEYIDYTDFIVLGVYGILVFGIYTVFRKIYFNETKYLLNELKIVVGIDSKENIEKIEYEKNEWTLKLILFRVFAYPFCIFIVIIALTLMIPKGDFIKGVFAIILAIGYIFSDIRMIQKKRKKTKANNG